MKEVTLFPVVFLKGKKTTLRPPEEKDISKLTQWINDPEIRPFVNAYFPTLEIQEREWLEKLKDKKDTIILVVTTKNGTAIGVMGIHNISWRDRVATTGAVIGEKQYWGKGYGTDAKMQVLNYAFNTLNMFKMCSSVISFNKRSLAYSKHCGYVVEGVRRKHTFRNGMYWDLIDLGLFKEEWLPYYEKYSPSTPSQRKKR